MVKFIGIQDLLGKNSKYFSLVKFQSRQNNFSLNAMFMKCFVIQYFYSQKKALSEFWQDSLKNVILDMLNSYIGWPGELRWHSLYWAISIEKSIQHEKINCVVWKQNNGILIWFFSDPAPNFFLYKLRGTTYFTASPSFSLLSIFSSKEEAQKQKNFAGLGSER